MTNNKTQVRETYYQTSRPHLAGEAGEPAGVLTVTLQVTTSTGSNNRFLTLFVSTVDENGKLQASWCYYFNDNQAYSCREDVIHDVESYDAEPLDEAAYEHFGLNYLNEYNYDEPENRYSYEEFLEQLWIDSYLD